MDPYPAAYDRICLFLSDLNLVLGSVTSKAPSGPLGGHPPRFDHVRPGAFSTNPAWGRPTARSRAWKRNHPKIFGQYPSKFHRPSPPVPVDNGFSRSNGTWVIPMRRDRGLHRGREDRGQHRFSKPASASTPSHNQQSQSHMEPTCEIIDESNLDFVSGLELNDHQPTDNDGEGIEVPEESADQDDSSLQSAADQSADNASDGINDPADQSDAESSDEPRTMSSGDHQDVVDCEIHRKRSGSQTDIPDLVEEPDSMDEQDCTQDNDDVSYPGPGNDPRSYPDDEDYCNDQDDGTSVAYNNDAAYHEGDCGDNGGYHDDVGYDYGDDGGGYDYDDDGGGYDYDDNGGDCDFYQDDYY